jgi:endonuclease YncB( thermonuclease family)
VIVNTLPLQTHPQHLKLANCRAVDGDTIIADILLPLGIKVQRRIRLKGFFAPEHGGTNPAAAEAATIRLQQALDVHEVHIACTGMRDDRYGRLTATLLLNGRAVHPGAVQGEYQLDLARHKRDLNATRAGGQSDRAL